jgi:hypothetical protein
MNILTTNPDVARAVAHQQIAERVRYAEEARTARAVRQAHREARASGQRPPTRELPWWTFRFLRPAH